MISSPGWKSLRTVSMAAIPEAKAKPCFAFSMLAMDRSRAVRVGLCVRLYSYLMLRRVWHSRGLINGRHHHVCLVRLLTPWMAALLKRSFCPSQSYISLQRYWILGKEMFFQGQNKLDVALEITVTSIYLIFKKWEIHFKINFKYCIISNKIHLAFLIFNVWFVTKK